MAMGKLILQTGVEVDIPLPADLTEMEQTLETMHLAFMEHTLSDDRNLRANVNSDCNQLRRFLIQLRQLASGEIR